MANSTERVGIHYAGGIAERNNWMFREQPVNDIGIDAHMEYVDEAGRVKRLLALQIKSGKSWFEEKRDNYIVFRSINERQYNYWVTNSLPCIIVLYNPENDQCIWQKLTKDTIKRSKKGNGFVLKVPTDQVFLDEIANKKLLLYSNVPEHIANYNFLLSQKKFMQILHDGGTIKLHSEEWVNKSSGKGSTELIIDNGITTEKILYPYYFPYTPYTEVFPKLFPWASFSVDKDYYEENDESIWQEYNCYYDEEIDQMIVVGESFEEFRNQLPPVRYIEHCGEVAEYMLVLSLNEFGKSFLSVDEYVSKHHPYVEARPETE